MNTSITVNPTKLTQQNVSHILAKCIHTEKAPYASCLTIKVEGIYQDFVLNKGALAAERQHIEDMLNELPKGFKQGWSFGEMYRTEDGRQWAYKIRDMEALMVLGVAIGWLKYPVPKNLWWSLPGGMPYVVLSKT